MGHISAFPLRSYGGDSHKSTIGLLVFIIFLGGYVYARRRRRYNAETIFAEQHGCQPMKNKYPCKWPLGLDVLHKQWKANAEKRLLAFQQPTLDEYGPTLEIKILGSVGFTTFDPENIEAALSTRFDDYCLGSRRNAMWPFIGEGIFTQDGGPWRHSRDLLRRPFMKTHYQNLEGFQTPVANLIAKISLAPGLVDLQPLFFQFTLATTTALIFGQPVESSEDDEQDSFASSFDLASWITTLRSRLTDFGWIYNPKRYKIACGNIKRFADGFVTRALSAGTEGKEEDAPDRYTFIEDLYVDYQDTSLVRDQLINILLAGRDTTASLLSWTFFLLVRYPRVLSRLQDEIQSVVGTALRLYPPVPINVRFANKATWLPRGGGPDGRSPLFVPRGLGLGLVPYYLHRRKDLYGEDSMDYRPERWEGPELADIGWGYLPFHGGPRLCLGKIDKTAEDFALTEASYVIIRILQEFPNIRLPPGYPVVPTGQEKQELTIFLKSAEGCKVSDLRVVLHNVRDAIQGRVGTHECGNLAYIVQRASQKMSELNRLIYGNLVKTPSTGCNSLGDDDTIKASRRAFLRHSGKIRSLKDEIQELKMSLLVAMGTLTFSDVSRLKLDICNVSLVASQQNSSSQPLPHPNPLSADNTTKPLKRSSPATDSSNAVSRSLTSRVPGHVSIQRSADVNAGLEDQQLMRAPTEHEILSSVSSSFEEYVSRPAKSEQDFPQIRVEASVSSVSYQRDRLCLCQCHGVTTMATPCDWTRLLGRLFIGYTGLPTPAKKCDRKSCQHGQTQTRIRVAYRFPFWFALRLIALTMTKASTSFMWKLDFPAVTEATSDLFVHTSLGNVERVQGYENGVQRAMDTDEVQIALQFRQVTAVSFLLEQGSDIYVQDCNNKTPLDTFYENYFITAGEKRMEALLPLFERFDVFDHWNLRQIHLIILGWSAVDLATYLSISPDEVDVFDSWGRTPLMWAAWRGDSQSVSTLLEYGADPHATSSDGNSVLIYATSGGSLECMKLILDTGADINHMSQSLLTPAMGGSQLGDNPAIAKVRLVRGAAIEASRHQKFTPLYVAALTNKAESLAYLLQRGASVDVSSWNCSTPLSMAISFSNHRMAEELIKRGADLNTAPAFTVSYLRNAAVFGDERMVRLFIDAKPAIDIALRDSQGCTAEDRMKERLMSMGPSDPRSEGLAAVFQELVDICAVEYEKAQRPIERILAEVALEGEEEEEEEEGGGEEEELVEEEDLDETFHDALEDQQILATPPPVYGTHATDWAVKRRPSSFSQDSGPKYPLGYATAALSVI
ncbi:MAG: hypothetical protein Q9170_007415 [Blastenia crenularia]